ncbi:MAG: hypothetical protein Q9201_007843 [Fulgogasparrea decipioides]
MESLGQVLENDDLQDATFNEQSDVSEVFEHGASTEVATSTVRNVDVVPWLDQRLAVAVGGDEGRCITRIVWLKTAVESFPWQLNIVKSSYDSILESFELKTACQLVPDGGIVCLPTGNRHQPNKQFFALSISIHHFALVWTYDSTTSCTKAICYVDERDTILLARIKDVLGSQKRLVRHPMFLGFVVAIVRSKLIDDDIRRINSEIISVENRTRHSPGHTPWQNTARGSYAALSALMSGSATSVATVEFETAVVSEILNTLLGYRWPQESERPNWIDSIIEEVSDCVRILQQQLNAQEQKFRHLSLRANIQLTALFNLITQQETRLSISVAQDSRTLAAATKDDSTAMKTLPAVTVVFLPSTFVAALFSMPLFNWDTQTAGHSAVSEQFWVYWAVSIPLTFVTLALWFAWTRLRMRRQRARDLEEREALNQEIDETSQEFV